MHLTLFLNHLGAGVALISELFQNCFLFKGTLLKGSDSADVRKLNYLSAEKHVEVNQTLEEYINFFSAAPHARKKKISKAKEKTGLGMQSIYGVKEILDICQPKTILNWQKVAQHVPSKVFSFCRKYLMVSLPTIFNLFRWKKISNESCTLCENAKQTQRHVISCCSKPLEDRRYTWRQFCVVYCLPSSVYGSQ